MRLKPDRWIPALVGSALAVAMSWPLVLHLGSRIGQDLGDPLFQTWQVGWIGHAALHQPLHLFQANIYWPLSDTLAFSDSLVGYAPVAVFAASGPHAALLGYNLLFLFSWAMAFLGAYLLARELGAGRVGCLCAGAAFAYAPWRLAQNGHLHVISSGGIPLAIALLLRGYGRRSSRFVFAGWLVAAWQMTLGFSLGLQLAYLLLALGAVALVLAVRQGRPFVARPTIAATAAGLCVFGLATFLQARPYLRVADDHPESKRTYAYVAELSPTWRGLLAAPSQSYVWADATEGVRKHLTTATNEQTLFPGVTIGLLALVGVFAPVFSRRRRLALATGTAVCAALSLGLPTSRNLGNFAPYRLLYEFAPGWDFVRTPGRIMTLTSLGLALLAAAGIAFLADELKRVVAPRDLRLRAAPGLVIAALIAAILAEGLGPLRVRPVPSAPPGGEQSAPAPQLHLPPDVAGYFVRYIYWSTADYKPIVNGYGSFVPTANARLLQAMTGFPDRRSVEALRRIGVRSVVFHRELAAGTPWEQVPRRSIAGLRLVRTSEGDLVVFRLLRQSV